MAHLADCEPDRLRAQLETLLRSGLETQWRERAYSSEQVIAVVGRLKNLDASDYPAKLVIGGFTLEPFDAEGELLQACSTCMYYSSHRRFCELPELWLPVDSEWSCVLWRI